MVRMINTHPSDLRNISEFLILEKSVVKIEAKVMLRPAVRNHIIRVLPMRFAPLAEKKVLGYVFVYFSKLFRFRLVFTVDLPTVGESFAWEGACAGSELSRR